MVTVELVEDVAGKTHPLFVQQLLGERDELAPGNDAVPVLVEDIEQLVIAGITSPWNQQELDGILDSYSEKVSGFKSEDLDTIKSLLASMTDGLGDGLVSVESTRLPGIAHMTVKGTHLSMIRNLTPDSERIPPALPIIIQHLQNRTPKG